MRRQTTK
ncbi:hypothetical protein YPPY42_2453, partial [Yersinia pestis PY-42]